MAKIVFYYESEYRCELSEEDYDKIIKYADDNEVTLEEAYTELKNNEKIDDYSNFADEVNSEFELEIE